MGNRAQVPNTHAEITLRNLPDGSVACTSFAKKDGVVHFGILFKRLTACGEPTGNIIFEKNPSITCFGCVAELIYRAKHRMAANRPWGVVTHEEALAVLFGPKEGGRRRDSPF